MGRATSRVEGQQAVGLRIRELRLKSGLSIKDLAAASGISVNTLSLIERGKTSPTVSTLQRLAAALRFSMVAFFEESRSKSRVVLTRSGDSGSTKLGYGSIRALGAGFMDSTVEPLGVKLKHGASSGAEEISHTGYEFVLCVKGEITYSIGERQYRLKRGDTLLFDSVLPHRWRNAGKTTTEFLLFLFPVISGERTAMHHFVPEPVLRRGKR